MALEMQDIMALKALGGNDGNTAFENFMMADKTSKRASNSSITALVLGSAGLLAGVGAWVFGGLYANGKSGQAREAARAASDLAQANHNNTLALLSQAQANTNSTLDRMLSTLAAERAERIAGDVTLTNTVNDSVSGSQQGTLTAQQAAELSSIQSVQNQLFTQAVMGNLSENAQKVQLYSAPQPCSCPNTCGCN